MNNSVDIEPSNRPGTIREVFTAFLILGLTSFGGPVAHLGYFRRELVEKRGWVKEGQFAQLMAICQFLPGPSSSQLGFSLGLIRAGWFGALTAFVAFTLPSALLLIGFATLLPAISGELGEAAIHGLKIVAVAVVAQGVLGMTRNLCPDIPRGTIAALAASFVVLLGSGWAQLAVVLFGAFAGMLDCRDSSPTVRSELNVNYGARLGWGLLAAFLVLLLAVPLLVRGTDGLVAVGLAFYQAGALVFGGGHVVLPMLEQTVVAPGWVSQEEFLAGYGAAQAVPGPMFSFSAYLGARLPGSEGGMIGASVALLSIFLPGFLLVSGAIPIWRTVSSHPQAASAIDGVNAAVVGLLGAALYDPVWVTAVRGPQDFAIAVIAFALLVVWRLSALYVVGWCVAASVLGAVMTG
jgi:chromate transporter